MYKFLVLSLALTIVSANSISKRSFKYRNFANQYNNYENPGVSYRGVVFSTVGSLPLIPDILNSIVLVKDVPAVVKGVGLDLKKRSMMKGRSLPNYETNNYYNPYGYSNGKYRFFPLVDVDINRFSPFVPFGQIPFGVHPGFINQFPISSLAANTATNQNSEQNVNIIGDKNNVEQNSDQISKDTVSQNVN